MKKNKPFLLGFVVGIIFGLSGFYLFARQQGYKDVDGKGISAPLFDRSHTEGRVESPNTDVIYTDDQIKFSLRYPRGLIYKKFDEGNDSQTIVFQKPGDAKTSFQIYITPYTGETITGERILFDIPSGNIRDLKEEQLRPDLRVATFISHDPFLGDIKEIWFIDGKYLYQATTFINLGKWLMEIISTWKFQ